ncbi:alkaline phosphatase [Janthinobacterium sp. B9-8]|uniref:alkaline phosphatase n=1 Tax=Janthinobacterium sp. B9-8 TaxID=1236179 RepID=UPI0007645EE4|nr:alkaline phosphatase [Janthinobacterium sp. B9-8]AMC35293.1 alkaline phosphatase [Janthinobacterium sp. B9-8]
MKIILIAGLLASALSACNTTSNAVVVAPVAAAPKNVIFFLGDGMGMTTLTAARTYAVGEDGELTIDTLPETAFIKTYSNDAQVTDSAPSMAAYMTGVKMNNEVISMSADTQAKEPGKDGSNGCVDNNGKSVTTLLEIAKATGLATGVVTTTRVTHATPAATYAHICHRDAENDIAAQFVPGGKGYNPALADGVDVMLGGGSQFFYPTAAKGKRTDGRDLVAELKAKGYGFAGTRAEFDALDVSKTAKFVGLFASSHMSYDLDRDAAKEPSLAEMTVKAIQGLKKNNKGMFLMVEGGRIDHALHETTAKKALQDTVAFDDAIKAALAEIKKTDPELKNTLIVVTADHDHTLVLNGYAKRTGKSSATNPGVLGLVKDVVSGKLSTDADGMPYTIIGFGNGESRGDRKTALDESVVFANSYHQEAAIRTTAGNETHGGTNVFLGAVGKGSDQFYGVMDNTNVFKLIRDAVGL